MSEFSILLGEELRIKRLMKRMTCEQVGEKMELRKTTVSKYEKGEITMSAENLFKYCDAVGADPAEVLHNVSIKLKQK